MDYRHKLISVEEALSKIKSGDVIVTGLAASEAKLILESLHTISDKVDDITVTTCLPMAHADYFQDPQHKDTFQMNGWFYTSPMRKGQKNGNISYIPNHLHLAAVKRLFEEDVNVYVGNATPPDKHGFVSLSLSNVYEKRVIEKADLVILEINPNLPRTFGEMAVHVDDIDYMIEADYEIPVLPDAPPNEKDIRIGDFIADFIEDGDCIQLGIGGIPNAVAAALIHKKDLGIHTEMLTTGLMKLMKAGVCNGKNKNINRGKAVCTFALGTKELYDFLDDNPSIEIRDGHVVNDPYEIGLNDNQVSINTTIEIDLTGQCCSESIGTVQYSGTGGQADTAIGAQRSKNGRSFIALYSTALVKGQVISKIVPLLKPGAAVTLSRNDVDYVVTEYGVASLRGTSIKERVKRLIKIAHPDFRDMLYEQAREIGYIR
ncbi:acetyl-CoA hydrolase/transferase family protein [Acidaminobacter sp. JC074]|uniref:acetyl-CoA hydrolase/transferase family protein n=1 Tax=Acidaminobacter sp. JC074 TaxID=2530199 RepID=UPI001F0F2654|nr:acetyl-CoA hydrolase/transferase C-terminal domain-containing protein [Acidaminobacter sp. JC074]MCH4886020.1 acetyl-CoA hydrolase/transferase family protein [Acidaminobacter sp. JC074]